MFVAATTRKGDEGSAVVISEKGDSSNFVTETDVGKNKKGVSSRILNVLTVANQLTSGTFCYASLEIVVELSSILRS